MAFGFFKDKHKGPISVTCPLCNSSQQESALAVSSYCKGCGAYLTFNKLGEVTARPLIPPDPFADRPRQPDVVVDYSPREDPDTSTAKPKTTDASAPEPSEKESSPKEEETPSPPDNSGPTRFSSKPEDKDQADPQPKYETREVTCFECGDTHAANVLANSTQCRECGRLISMANREFRESWSGPIQTRGDVHIHKKGLVRTASVECHNLIVEGDFTGNAICSGDLIIRRHGKIPGQIRCKRLLVEKRAKVEFLGPVEMDEGRIDGLVTGNLACHGLLALEKKAILTGNLKVGSLTVADGAKHNGQVRMGPF